MENKTREKLVLLLEEARKEIAYYKRLAKEAGDVRLRETEELSEFIRERKKAEEALQKARDEQEMRIAERTTELSKANVYLKNEISERERAEEALRKRLIFEKMLNDISTLAALEDDTYEFLSNSLEIIGTVLNVSRVYIFEHNHETDTMDNTVEWVAENISPQKENLQGIPADAIQWWMDTLKNNRIVNFKDIDDIPGEKEKEILRKQGIKSVLVVPLFVKRKYYGFIGFDECMYHHDWLDEVVNILKTTSQVLSRVIESKIVAEELKDSERKYRTLFEDSLEAMILAQGGVLVDANPAWLKMHGFTDIHEVVGRPTLDFIHPEDHEAFEEWRKTWLDSKEPIFQRRNIRKDGSTIYVEVFASSITFGGKKAVLATIRDMTELRRVQMERKNLEDQLQRAQKMEAIGTLAGGVAHDLNNVLSGLVSYPELLLMDVPEDSPLRPRILKIQKSGEKAANIVQDLLTLARRGIAVTENVDLNRIVDEYLKSPEFEMLKQYHPKIAVEVETEDQLFNILGSSVHLSKTVMNLVSNAAEAMPDGGKISIATRNSYIDRPLRGYENIEEGEYVVLKVKDEGVGIPSQDFDKIFEPFYTKKVMGRSGTGLGMAVVWGTVKDHRGYIEVQSGQGHGTELTLYFPATRNESIKDKSRLLMNDYMGRGESILVVDDVEEQRELACGFLEKLGYSVKSVSNGKMAIDYMKNNRADLLVLDMIMAPGVDGLDTYKEIIKIHPGQKAIIASGFSETDRVKEAQRLGAGPYVKKPYTLEKIGIAVREELDLNK